MKIIYTNNEGGVSIIIPTGELPIAQVAAKDVPAGAAFEIVEDSAVPSDRLFRNAWVMGDCCIEHDLDKCKEIGHTIRRAKRAEEFAPYDEVIAKQIPGNDPVEAESARQLIRDKYIEIQDNIDASSTPEQIKSSLEVTL